MGEIRTSKGLEQVNAGVGESQSAPPPHIWYPEKIILSAPVSGTTGLGCGRDTKFTLLNVMCLDREDLGIRFTQTSAKLQGQCVNDITMQPCRDSSAMLMLLWVSVRLGTDLLMLLYAVGIITCIEDHLIHDASKLSISLLHLFYASWHVRVDKTQRRMIQVEVHSHTSLVTLMSGCGQNNYDTWTTSSGYY